MICGMICGVTFNTGGLFDARRMPGYLGWPEGLPFACYQQDHRRGCKYSGAKLRELRVRRGVGNYPRARERVHGGQLWSDARRLMRRVARII